jgi:ribosomal protein L11 methyltransferase
VYSLRLICRSEEVDFLSAELYEAGTVGIREIDGNRNIILVAAFETNQHRSKILTRFSTYAPDWYAEDAVDWAKLSHEAWPAREVGKRFLLAPPWSTAPTPQGRLRLIHNPGLACGTGEHPCTQLALMAIEKVLRPGCTVADVGTGSGLLAIAALQLGAARAIGIDIDCAALAAARENFHLNALAAELVCGSADAVAAMCSDLTVANISATVLLAIWEELLRITRRPGHLILTGFPEGESKIFRELLPQTEVFEAEGWHCLAARLS